MGAHEDRAWVSWLFPPPDGILDPLSDMLVTGQLAPVSHLTHKYAKRLNQDIRGVDRRGRSLALLPQIRLVVMLPGTFTGTLNQSAFDDDAAVDAACHRLSPLVRRQFLLACSATCARISAERSSNVPA